MLERVHIIIISSPFSVALPLPGETKKSKKQRGVIRNKPHKGQVNTNAAHLY